MTRRKFEVPHGIFWPAMRVFAHQSNRSRPISGATLHPSVAALIVKEWLTPKIEFELSFRQPSHAQCSGDKGTRSDCAACA
ncbi:hypothetical protein BH10PSE10_BH10PSE10_13430 [soil metagenome]